MLITILLSVMMMAGLFMLLWGGVGFIQDKKFFSSAPKEAIEVTPDYMPERFKGQHVVGYIMVTIAFALMGGAVVIGAWNGIKNDFTFWQFFFRFVFIFSAYKIYDMICFDYFLLMKYHFFQFYFPEVEKVYTGRKYGYNLKSQLLKLLVIFPAASGIAAWICTLFV